MNEWKWVSMNSVLAIHDWMLAEYGGLDGVRDQAAIESAIARPKHLHAYGKVEIEPLAAAYAFGIAKNHGFADGNKRTAFVVMELFLMKNGHELICDRTDAVQIINGLADGSVTEADMEAWLRERVEDFI